VPRPITILLVDDDVDYRTLTREAIGHVCPSARVWEVSGGAEALEFLRRRGRHLAAPRADIVYTDLEMPDMSGQELLKAVRSHPDLVNVPVVMLTGLADEAQRTLALANGAGDYAVKSTDHSELRRTMARTIRQVLGPLATRRALRCAGPKTPAHSTEQYP